MVRPADMPIFSVVIPTLNEAPWIARTLAHVRRKYSYELLEIIVSDGGSTDSTVTEIPAGVRLVTGARGRGRAAQMNLGAAHARGRILLFCHADTLLPNGWAEAVERALHQPGVVGGGFQPCFEPMRGITLRLLNWPRPLQYPAHWLLFYGDQVLFCLRPAFEQAGGFPDQPIMEDLEFARSLSQIGRLVRLPCRVRTSSRRFLERGPLRLQLANINWVVRYACFNASPVEIAAAYREAGAMPARSARRRR